MREDELTDLASGLRPRVSRLYQMLRRRTPRPEYSTAQASALTVLIDHGPMRMGELAEREGVRMPTISAQVDGLAKMGLVERTPDPSDRRAVLVGLSEHGRQVIESVARYRDEAVRQALEKMPADQVDALYAAIPALTELEHQLELLRPETPAHTTSED
ncbi:MarR family transcriptional regulator [Gordonia jinhuaensis]|uniref:HTH marR-type domain-containing protein n=1 Tax=Gordonia jinhuaensis TaxID=1517702 RepID=A0A916TFF2_9ACTN|nr:MarR family transcriptional regulator [Gordonia jinhuaensis]GGB42850.1 hypothetical protein GCM10011489_32940 [Gordonia jinhuaensis]